MVLLQTILAILLSSFFLEKDGKTDYIEKSLLAHQKPQIAVQKRSNNTNHPQANHKKQAALTARQVTAEQLKKKGSPMTDHCFSAS